MERLNWKQALDLARQPEPDYYITCNMRRVDGPMAVPTHYDREDLRKKATGEWKDE